MLSDSRILVGAALLLAASLVGCGSGSGASAPVRGKVVAGGQPVTGGTLTFSPLAQDSVARSAQGEIQPDGTFELTTERPGDGAAIGKHQVSYMAPLSEVTESETADALVKLSPLEGLLVKEAEIEVKPGDNELTIELVRGQ
jgi:hypothetical protein